MVMELLEGRSLATLLADAGKLPVSRALRLVDQVLSALAAAHKRGIVHRDLKPDNIFVVETEYQPDFVKLLDFGISKILAARAPDLLGERRKETRMGTVMGTPEYMAPEQAAGWSTRSTRAPTSTPPASCSTSSCAASRPSRATTTTW
jgi:serine/threonine-protein kinase